MAQYLEPAVSSSPDISLRQAHELALAASQPRYWLHGFLLMATCFTTLVVGAHLQLNFLHNQPAYTLAHSLAPRAVRYWRRRPHRRFRGRAPRAGMGNFAFPLGTESGALLRVTAWLSAALSPAGAAGPT